MPWPLELRTRDGAPFCVRPIRADDIERERRFIVGLSAESLYNRLLYTLREPSDAFVKRLVNVDYRRTMALVATVGAGTNERFIAVARYACDADSLTAEFAIVVADEWQNRGVGTQLAKLLFGYAAEHGVEILYGHIAANNERMRQLVRDLGLTIQSVPGDATLIRAEIAVRAPSN
ncbi:MAG: GNAT family N-acetyltransferase [Steroidobacteraceae bacterium]|nr:GNAT family N-acetyltransferase [Steroidobacteraceae bacterium]MDW8259587.1 GNAT family N-acetyltransferase [Gammaproteobacteria bacterium]